MQSLTFISIGLVIVLLNLSKGFASSIYTVVAPSVIRPNQEYHVSVGVQDISAKVEITVAVEGFADNGNYNSISTPVILNSEETQIVKLGIGEWSHGNYSLTVSGTGGLEFYNQTELTYKPKSYSVFIQTDKAIYRPENLVQFRTIIVDNLLLPTVTGAISMYINDPNGNRIKQWNKVFTSKGVVSKELQLSDQPILGDWTINIEILGQEYKKTFTVAEYVLPTFDVQLKLPAYATYKTSDIVVSVKSLYTFGKEVKGEVIIRAEPIISYYTEQNFKPFETKVPIDGTADIPINLIKDLNIPPGHENQVIDIKAEVIEEHTHRRYNASASITIYETDIKVQMIKASETFKPGLPYTAVIKVFYRDDTPITDEDQLILFYGSTYIEENWQPLEFTVPSSGYFTVEIPNPDINATIMASKAVYRGMVFYFSSIEAAVSPSNSFLQVSLTTLEPELDKEIEIEARCTEPMTRLSYQVMGRGDILLANTISIPNTNKYKFNVMVTNRMAPKARIVVYYIRKDNGEIVADAVNFELGGVFRTEVSVGINTNLTRPGKQVEIEVHTKPNAFIGLLGVDQSVRLLKTGNDITEQDVVEELDSYDQGTKNWPQWNRGRGKRSMWWHSSLTASQVFSDSGILILTNAWLYEPVQFVSYRYNPVPFSAAHPEDESHMSIHASDRQHESKTKVRHFFPETWLWNNTHAGTDGTMTLRAVVPDTITSWVVSAFAVDPITGLGVAPDLAKVTVYRNFFVKLNLPYSVVRGETISIQALIFNYNPKPVKAEVTLENGLEEFEFSLTQNEVDDPVKRETKVVMVPSNGNVPVTFVITPKKLGYIDLMVTAISPKSGDSLLRKLLVKPEGTPNYFNKAVLLDLRSANSRPITTSVEVEIPQDVVPGSEHISISAIGDIMGPSVNNLDQLLRLPSGCGEQNMLNFVPSIVILEYLKRANRITPHIEAKSLRFMETGYQRELTYQREDGSFSAFGQSDKSGSTWLSSFVLKSFHQASQHIDIDGNVLNRTIHWLIRHQREDGAFAEPGEVHHKSMQGGSSGGASLTAYVLIALLENQVQSNYSKEIQLAVEYIERELNESQDPYLISLVAYVLHLLDHPSQNQAFTKLHSLAKIEGDMMYWSKNKVPQSIDVEMTAYALMTFTRKGDLSSALPIMRWLISQQNEYGGYSSTQDTVIAIQALGQLASHLVSSNVEIEIKYPGGNLTITQENAVVLQRHQLSNAIKVVGIEAKGFGVGIVQVSWQYNTPKGEDSGLFYLNPQLELSNNNNNLQVSICTHVNDGEDTNMAVMEVGLPSGYQAEVADLKKNKKVKRVETQEGGSRVVLYFDQIGPEKKCVDVPGYKAYSVADHQPTEVKVYDYYNLAKSASVFYQISPATVCDICSGDSECETKCSIVSRPSSSSSRTSVTGLIFMLTLAVGFLITTTH